MKSPTRVLRAVVAIFALLLAHAGHSVCVSTQAQLIQALNDVRYAPDTIEIVQGTYHIEQSPWYIHNNYFMQPGTSLVGGYTAACASRQIAAGNTVLVETSGFNGAVFDLVGNLTFEGITLNLAHGLYVSVDANIYSTNPGTQFVISRSELTGTISGSSIEAALFVYWAQDGDLGGIIKVFDTLAVANNSLGSAPDSCAIAFEVANGTPQIFLTNNTIVDNVGGGVCFSNSPAGQGVFFLHDNILYGNSPFDFYSDSANMELVDNTIGTHSNPPLNPPPIGTLTSDPALNATYHPIQAPASPVINSGEAPNGNLPSTDLDGGARVVGSRVDRGAYESSIDDSTHLIVTNTNDAGTGSLRNAIASANSNIGYNYITFDLPGACPSVIELASELPAIGSSLSINGYTQSGSAPNDLAVGDDATICVVIDGNTNGVANGLSIDPAASPAPAVTIRGIAFGSFVGSAIKLNAGTSHFITGNHIGGAVGGVTLFPASYGVYIGAGVNSVYVGGLDAADRNIIGDAFSTGTQGDGIFIAGPNSPLVAANNNFIVNNYIGVGWNNNSGTYVDRGNAGSGIHVSGFSNAISGNLIGYNARHGVDFDGNTAFGNTLQNNNIGADDSNTAVANDFNGVMIENDSHANTLSGNRIANNQSGVAVETGRANTIRKNIIYQNNGLGIDLAALGVTANDDDGNPPTGDYANRGQNFPVLTFAGGSTSGGQVSGTLTTTQGVYTIDIYSSAACDTSGHGEGARWLASGTVSVPAPSGFIDEAQVSFTLTFALLPPAMIGSGAVIAATATDANGNTSEFSACADYTNDVIFADAFGS